MILRPYQEDDIARIRAAYAGGASRNHGAQSQCWELDAMDPNDLRDCKRSTIWGRWLFAEGRG